MKDKVQHLLMPIGLVLVLIQTILFLLVLSQMAEIVLWLKRIAVSLV